MNRKISPTFYAVCAVILACLTGMLFGSCSLGNSCTVVMTETNAAADPVTLTIGWNGTSYSDLSFSINGTAYDLVDFPTAEDPVYRLEAENDGMAEVFLQLAYDDGDVCVLHMIPEEGRELVFAC
ncbi:MAG: hypothetical protein IKY52_01910, partial [Clostridia bacterium]|nr:hypothetical protein [Clostridia bacterium]